MLLFGHERVFASIEVDRIALVKLAGRGASAPVGQCIIEALLDPEQPEEALGKVGAVLADPLWNGAQRHVVLSDRLVRYLLVERPQGARSLDEFRLAIEARFEQAFDASVEDWEIVIDTRPFKRHFVACGVPRRILYAARNAFRTGGRCTSIRPFLVCELERLAKRLPPSCWFAAAARDCVALIGITSSECRYIRVLPIDSSSSSSIAETVEREELLSGDAEGSKQIFLSGVPNAQPEAAPLTRLDAPHWRAQPASWSSTYRLALAEVWP